MSSPSHIAPSAAAAAASSSSSDSVPSWLRSLPLAPEFHPTAAEFADPIAYILRIEPAAAPFGLCKIVPPFPAPSKKSATANLIRSFSPSAAPDAGCGGSAPTFSTRQQQLGLCPRRPRPALKNVWLSPDSSTLPQFEARAAAFRRSYLARHTKKNSAPSPLDIEALFWRAAADRPITVEYANDMPGSAFAPVSRRSAGLPMNVGETAWNMRGVARAPGSPLRFMREDIPGVTSPMVYVAMMFSWFAWHVEDHELHSLNYLHFGAGKTWYGVPRDAAAAFEEVVRVHGYSGEVNPLVTFATLGEKTTVMSPEVLVCLGIPCCRLVQNAGEFVVTFPGAYHSGFSHGFNCSEASNIATPGWLKIAKEAAIKRASINCPPMLSHYQLLFELALSLCSRKPSSGVNEPRSSRLKDKKKGEGEQMIKRMFVQNIIDNNRLLGILDNNIHTCVVLPRNSHCSILHAKAHSKSPIKFKSGLRGLCNCEDALLDNAVAESGQVTEGYSCLSISKDNSLCLSSENKRSDVRPYSAGTQLSSPFSLNAEVGKEDIFNADGLLDQGLLSCVACGILSFSCVAVIQPTEETAKSLMSTDYSLLSGHKDGLCLSSVINNLSKEKALCTFSGESEMHVEDRADVESIDYNSHSIELSDHSTEVVSNSGCPNGSTALDLLASAYGGPSDSDVEEAPNMHGIHSENNKLSYNYSHPQKLFPESQGSCGANVDPEKDVSSNGIHIQERTATQNSMVGCDVSAGPRGVRTRNKYQLKMVLSEGYQLKDIHSIGEKKEAVLPSGSVNAAEKPVDISCTNFSSGWEALAANAQEHTSSDNKLKSSTASTFSSDKDLSRMHVFCLEHAVEVEKLLQGLGGAKIMLLCHPEYPKIEAEAKLMAEEMGINYDWNDVHFKEADKDTNARIREALNDEEAVPTNSDWAVKMGINLYYSANLANSPLYSKQLPYNKVIYEAFSCKSPGNSPAKPQTGKRPARQKKILVAGRWCGRVWMTNQVHPLLAHQVEEDEVKDTEDLYHQADVKPKAESEYDDFSDAPTVKTKGGGGGGKSILTTSGRKRKKKSLGKKKTKKAKSDLEDAPSKKSAATTLNSIPQFGMVLRSTRTKRPPRRADDHIVCVKEEKDATNNAVRRRPLMKLPQSKPTISKRQSVSAASESLERSRPARPANSVKAEDGEHTCDIEGCGMSFSTRQDLAMHKRDICPVKGCGKKFFSHKYLVQHRKVHMDDRPLECPWKGCNMTFKWPWARTEHIRVHTGDRPYVCLEPGCGQTFRFVSDFSRHKRKTGHSVKKSKRDR